MRIGLDGFAVPNRQLGPFEMLDFVRQQGLEGCFFGSLLALSPALDAGMLRELRACADERGLYLEVGVGNVNPARFVRFPAVAALGEGDYARGFERLIRAGRALGCVELRVDLGGEAARFNPAAPWAEQLAAGQAFLEQVAPLCRDLGCRLDIETHADITTFELARVIEAVGSDVVGVCLDTANVLCRAEEPLAAARRVAPYVHQTHVKDAILYFTDDGLMRQSRPCGQGIIDWGQLLPLLAAHEPTLTLSIEDHKGLFGVPIYDPAWQALHPDLTAAELAELVRHARVVEARVARGELAAPAAYEAVPWAEQALERLAATIAHLRAIRATHGLAA
jgi:sugar phosphate isomerase/epimerase